MIGILCKVDMEAFCVLSIVVVSSAIQLNKIWIMTSEMKLWYLEICTHTKVNKDIFVVMESFQCGIEHIKGLLCVNRILCKVEKIE